MRTKKIIFFGFSDFKRHKRGVENVILSQRHSFKNLKVDAMYIHFGDKKRVHKYQDILCIEIPKTSWFIWINLILFYLKKKFHKQGKAHLIHSHNYLLSCFCLYNTDIFSVHDGLYYQKKAERLGINFIWKSIERFVYFRSRKLHFISDFSFSKSLASPATFKRKGIKIFNTTPLEFISDYTNSSPAKIKYQVLIVRSIERRANIGLVVEVAKKLSNTNPNLAITVIGKGPLLAYYQERIENENVQNMKMLGYVSDCDLVKYYKACDLVVVPCLDGEGFGLPVIEGYLFNKPVLASNICALPEVIIDSKFLFKNDANDLSEMLVNIMKSDLKEDFFKYYLQRFSSSVIEKKYLELYASFSLS